MNISKLEGYKGKIGPIEDFEFDRPVSNFLAICVHTSEMAIAHVDAAQISIIQSFSYEPVVRARREPDHTKLLKQWDAISSLFNKVEYVVAFNVGPHRGNLRKTLEHAGLHLPNNKYVCLYKWAKDNLATTTLHSLCEKMDIDSESDANPYHVSYRYSRDYEYQVRLVSDLTILLQRDYGLILAQAVTKTN